MAITLSYYKWLLVGAVSIHDKQKDRLKEKCEEQVYSQKAVVTKLVKRFCDGDLELEF